MNLNTEKTQQFKFKQKQFKRIATDFLTNISLHGSTDEAAKDQHYDKLIANDFDCFLAFNRISTSKGQQSEYFNYYMQNVLEKSLKTSKFELFLLNEFKQTEAVSANTTADYIESILSRPDSHKVSCESTINKTSIVPSVLAEKSPEKLSNDQQPSDLELDYLNTYKQFPMLKSKSTKKSSESEVTKADFSEKLTSILESGKGSNFDSTQTSSNLNTKLSLCSSSMNVRYRATSESSTESNFNSSLTSNSNTLTKRYYKANRPYLFNIFKKLTNEKLILTFNQIPLGIFSRISFRPNTLKAELNDSLKYHQSIPKSSHNFTNDVFELLDLDFDEYIKKGEMSYENLIDPSGTQAKQRSIFKRANTFDEAKQKDIQSEEEKPDEIINEKEEQFKRESNQFLTTAYQPDYLDDPQLTELTAGKNRTCLKFASYAVSIIDYVKPLDLKKEINATFKEKFPLIQITLTKLRSIKREILEIGIECMLDLIIVAQSYVYFEKLILLGLINKPNRKFLAANCLLIAAKLNDITKKDISKLIDAIQVKFRFDNKREMISYEFSILIALEFNLMIKYETEFLNHYERLKNSIENSKLKVELKAINE